MRLRFELLSIYSLIRSTTAFPNWNFQKDEKGRVRAAVRRARRGAARLPCVPDRGPCLGRGNPRRHLRAGAALAERLRSAQGEREDLDLLDRPQPPARRDAQTRRGGAGAATQRGGRA